jgi:hypothetical protein
MQIAGVAGFNGKVVDARRICLYEAGVDCFVRVFCKNLCKFQVFRVEERSKENASSIELVLQIDDGTHG